MLIDKEFDDLMDEAEKSLERSKREGFEFIYDDVLNKGLRFIFDTEDQLKRLCMVYDMYVFYLIHEEYERCSVLKEYLFEAQLKIFSRRKV